MTESELLEISALFKQMDTTDLLKVKRMAKAEIDSRGTKPANKRIVRSVAPWPQIMTRGER